MSVVTDMCLPDNLEVVEFEDIIAVASGAEPKLTKLVTGLLEAMYAESKANCRAYSI